MPSQHRFYLSRLDSEAADLHLSVNSPDELQRPVGAPSHIITGPVQPLALAERVRHESLGSQFRLVEVTARQPIATDIQLAQHSRTGQLHRFTQHVHLRVADRAPDWYALRQLCLAAHPVAAGKGRGFGWTIAVDDHSTAAL